MGPQLSDFRLGCAVVGSDGAPAGLLVSVLVEGQGFDPRALVIRKHESLAGRVIADERLFITDEVVVPIDKVATASHGEVRLAIEAADVQREPPYLDHHFVSPSIGQVLLQEAAVLSGGVAFPPAVETANEPRDEVEIDRGENVMLGKTGRRLGRVEEVIYDHGELVGIVLKPEGFFKSDVVLPIRFITRADDMALFAEMSEEDIEGLKPFDAGKAS